MSSLRKFQLLAVMALALTVTSCGIPKLVERDPVVALPDQYANGSQDTTNMADVNWHDYFNDPHLGALIDTALKNNQELNIIMQEIAMGQNEVMAKVGEYLPSVGANVGAGADKVGRYTTHGAFEATTEMEPGEEIPEVVPDYLVAANAHWEVDIWRKLRNGRDAAIKRYLATSEGKNFMVTNLVAEIANAYYELLALDNQLDILNQNITLQQSALKIVRLQKQATRVTELAVKRFEAEVLSTRSMMYNIRQKIIETENEINFLVGRLPQTVDRDPSHFQALSIDSLNMGIPVQLMENRPDIRQAELELEAANLDIKVARAEFYPSLGISANVGLNAFRPSRMVNPESLIFSLLGDITAPLVNRKAIKANFMNANRRQLQAVYNYERTVLMAYIEVVNQTSRIDNINSSLNLKIEQVAAMTEAINIANNLFKSAHADYMEVMMTQRDALEAKFELIELKMEQMHSKVAIYRSLGGGWQ